MKTSNVRYGFLALVVVASLYSGCQKAAPRGIKGKVGAGPLAQDSQFDQKIDQVSKDGKTLETCSTAVINHFSGMTDLMKKADQIVKDNMGKELSAEMKKDLLEKSANLYAARKAILTEMVKSKTAVCGSNPKVSISQVKMMANATVLSIAKLVGEETPESKDAEQNKKSSDDAQSGESLVGRSFKISKELIEVLNERGVRKFTHVVDGKIQDSEEKYNKIRADDSTATGCLLMHAPQERLSKKAQATILSATLRVEEKKATSNGKDAVQKTVEMDVKFMLGQAVFDFSCRLGKSLKDEASTVQVLKAFGSLLQDIDLQ